MIYEKSFVVSVDLPPQIAAVKGLEDALLAHVKTLYEKRCEQAVFIMEVLSVKMLSMVMFTNNNLSGIASISIEFRAKVMQYLSGEVIHGAVVEKAPTNQSLIAKTEYASILIHGDTQGHTSYAVKHGYRIPVTVIGVTYPLRSQQMAVVANVWYPMMKERQDFIITEPITSDDPMFQMLFDHISQLKKDLAQHADGVRKWFRAMMYPYTDKFTHKIEGTKTQFSMEAAKALKKNDIITYPDTDIDRDGWWKIPTSSKNKTIHISAKELVGILLVEYIRHLTTWLGFIIEYPSLEKAKAVESFWVMCAQIKNNNVEKYTKKLKSLTK